jgi:2-polyprenyl-3-methyl-5-hydroxy-6-metoxy-1,4-benzoquinol methylase
MHNPATQWERFGQLDPYYGVYSTDEFRQENLDDDARERFFASGRGDVERALTLARRAAGPGFAPASVLDHGCGVGRLVVNFASEAERVVGVDVSPSMLAEARRNCEQRGLDHVEFVPAERLGSLAPEFDLVHSFIVLQHIPTSVGVPIIETLARLVRPGGVGVLHLPVAAPDRRTRLHTWVTRSIPFAYNVANLLRRRPWAYPHMQMNVYDVNAVAVRLMGLGYERVTLELHPPSDGAAYASATLVFVRP